MYVKMKLRKLCKAKQERLILVNHITLKSILGSLKICLATKSETASMNGSNIWLNYDVTNDSVTSAYTKLPLCSFKAERSKEDTSLDKNFNNWKKALTKFDKHQRSFNQTQTNSRKKLSPNRFEQIHRAKLLFRNILFNRSTLWPFFTTIKHSPTI